MKHFAFPSKEIPFGKDATIQISNAFCGANKTINMCCDHQCEGCRWKDQATLGKDILP
jgi:hypothetical protein